MNNMSRAIRQAVVCGVALLAAVYSAQAARTDLAEAPLETSSPSLVKPNILYVLDDSGSMDWDFMPDFVSNYSGTTALYQNSRFNTIYYDPGTTYTPPVGYQGTPKNSMTAGNTSNWTRVPNDAYGVQDTGNSNLVGSAGYYSFTAGEYCSGIDLRNCNAQTSPSATYPYPAYVRWCNQSNLTDCQASRIDTAPTGGKTYTNVRYPGQFISDATRARATITVTRTGVSITSVTAGAYEILSAATASSNSTATIASRIAASINACTNTSSGNCSTSGFSATSSGSTVTVSAPASLGAFAAQVVVTPSNAASATTFSGGVAAVYVPGNNTLAKITSGGSYPQDGSRTDCVNTTTCTYAEEMTNYANWWAYYHTRMQMTKSAASLAFASLTTSYRLGFMTINNTNGRDFLNVLDITTESGGQKSQWYDKLTAATPSGTTPLKRALSTAGRYYAGKLRGTTVNGVTGTDPMQYACQRNYTLMSTDGYWNESTTPANINNSAIGDVDGASGVARPYFDGTATSNTLADIAQYYYTTDIRSSIFGNANNAAGVDVSNNDTRNGPQRMLTYTIGLGVSGYMQYQPDYQTAGSGDYFDVLNGNTADGTRCRWQASGACNWPVPLNNTLTGVDDLWHAAVNGRGTYYSAGDPVALKDGIANFLNNVDAQNSAGAAVTPSTANVTSADNYLFDSSFWSVQWFGELARYTIDPATGIPGTVPDWSQSGTASTTSATPPTPLLDSVAYASRKIYTYDPAGATGTLIPFDWASLSATTKDYFRVAALGSLSQMCGSGSNCVPVAQQINSTTAGTDTGIGGINLVNYLRGDRSNEGAAGGKYYFKRAHVLGDIVGSQTAYVKRSTFNYSDTGYAAFKAANESRQGMVYVGANDGMLHAFNADNGAESWAYVPSMLLPKLYQLVDKNYGADHSYFVNGSPQQGEVYFDDAWHTILVGGLAAGGRGYYALDVTTPNTPKVLWEFTSDTSKGAPYISDADLGYTYGIPIVSKLSDGTWVVIVSSGYNNVSPGNGGGYLWVLNAKTGAIIKKIATGVGSATAVVAGSGCTAAPCPSGMARISAWMDNVNLNNKLSQVYSGDLFGNVWRFDLSNLTATGGTAPVQLLATLRDATNNAQPITSWVELGFVNNNHVVYVGTGSYLGVTDIGSTQVQSIYAIKDPLTTSTATGGLYGSPRAGACSATAKTACFMKQAFTDTNGSRTVASTMSYGTNVGAMNGWFIDLPNTGERINTDSTLQLGMLVFVSNIPNNSNACGTGGSAYLNYLDYKTGLNIRTTNVAGVLLAAGNGLGSAPAVLSTPTGKLIASVKLSTGQRVDVPLPSGAGGTGTRRVSWRELITR